LLAGQTPRLRQRLNCQQRVPLTDRREVAAVEELQKLHRELDVADAAAAGLHVAVVGPGVAGLPFDRPLQRLNLVDFAEAKILPVNERLDGLQEFAAEAYIPGDGPGLDEGLPFPGPAHRVVIGERAR